MLTSALLLPLGFDNTVQARICITPDSPLGTFLTFPQSSREFKMRFEASFLWYGIVYENIQYHMGTRATTVL
jgi:hypothetical protein